MAELDDLRRRGVRLLALCGLGCTAVFALIVSLFGFEDGSIALAVSALINLPVCRDAWRNRYDAESRIGVGVMAALQPAILVFLLRGSAWQMDMHMYFFVSLAALTLLCDWRPIAVASVIVAVHHVLASLLSPDWAFTGSGAIGRVAIHAIAVALQFLVLAQVTRRLGTLIASQVESRARSERLAESAAGARREAEAALARARKSEARAALERKHRGDVQRAADAARTSDMLAIAAEFETSVAAVVGAVGAAAGDVQKMAGSLVDLARQGQRRAASVAAGAGQSSLAARDIAERAASLARSVAQIAANADQQTQLSLAAHARTAAGEDRLHDLSDRVNDIDGFAEQIATVAKHTNLLALNATIEAARAGEAGTGFAVVASEVKQLAHQSRAATSEIKRLIGSVGDGAANVERALIDIVGVVDQLGGAAETIRAEVAEQRATTDRLNASAEEAAASAVAIAGEVAEVAATAVSAERLAGLVNGSSERLTESARRLEQATTTFLNSLRTA
ncbi:methyl-accepting chemotaxis protein [Sphingosinicella sp. BN140058]|uniref:methyl-accepting chemotaxis protein n=1 Tax=Sphingosinicella sp. BN140058 TaxID=1892855 RepID=UPI001013AD02|nr:methyl-accepting chemotaxis protein [Sphingosinicella sp. BN140058]QAY76315.1 chemotaxis protein [Sphingosinicella sp. BN140058]